MKRIYLTVDVECHDIKNINQYIYGNWKNGYCGLKRILDIGKEFSIPINFFLDVVESKRYGDSYIEEIVDLIRSYDQPVFFHLHPNYITGNDAKSFLWEYNISEQASIFEESLKIYEKFCGASNNLIFRAGRYGVDPNFYEVLKSSSVKIIDLSYFYGNMKMCHLPFSELGSMNKPIKYKTICVLPNTTYIGFDYFGKKTTFILNCANTTFTEFKNIITQTKLDNVVYTMHSWDLMKKWFFKKEKVSLDRYVEKRLKKCLIFANNNGFTFSDLRKFEYLNDSVDDLLNCCKGFNGKIKGLFSNFVRFWLIGRINKKYFFIYMLSFLIIVLGLTAFVLLILYLVGMI